MDLRTAKSLPPREYHARRDAARRTEREAVRKARHEQGRELATAVDLRPLRGAVAEAVRDGGEKVYR